MSKFTLDEAIKHCLEVAEGLEKKANTYGIKQAYIPKSRETVDCISCAADHRQLAEWLTELKKAKSMLLDYSYTVDIMCNKVSGTIGCEKCTYYNAETHDCEVRAYITETRAFVKKEEIK